MPDFSLFSKTTTEQRRQSRTSIAQNPYTADIPLSTTAYYATQSAFTGTATTGQVVDYANIQSANAQKKNVFQSEDAYKQSSYYHPNIKFYKGLTEEGARLSKDRQERLELQEIMASKAPVTSFSTTLIASTLDPINLAVSALTLGVGGKALTASKSLAKSYKALSPTKQLLAGAGVESIASTALIATGTNIAGKVTGDEMTAQDAIIEAGAGFALGVGFPLGINKVKSTIENYRLNPIEKRITDVASQNGIDPDYFLGMTYIENEKLVFKKTNPDTGAFGYFQFLPNTAKDYGIDANSTEVEQFKAIVKFTKDNEAHLEKAWGRKPDNLELYMAHWLGRTGAAKVLQGDRNRKFVDAAQDIYKNPEAVLIQNNLPKDATIADMMRSRADLMASKLRNVSNRDNFKRNMNELLRADHAIEKTLNDEQVDFSKFHAEQMQNISTQADKFLEEFNTNFDKQIADIETRVNESITKEDFDSAELEADYQNIVDNIKGQIDENYTALLNSQNETFGDVLSKKTDPVNILEEIDIKPYAQKFDDLEVKRQEYLDLANKAQAFDIETRTQELASQTQTPINTITAIDNETAILKQQREQKRVELTGKKLKLYDKETQRLLNDLYEKRVSVKLGSEENAQANNIQNLKEANRTAKQELKALRLELSRKKSEIKVYSQALVDANNDFKQKVNKYINESFIGSINPKRNYIDYEAIKEVEKTTEFIDSTTPEQDAKILEQDIETLKREKAPRKKKDKTDVQPQESKMQERIALAETQKKIKEKIKAEQKTETIRNVNINLGKNKSIPARLMIVEADNLITSNSDDGLTNKAYPKELQPRDRTSLASKTQIADIAQNLDPDILIYGSTASQGTPIIGEDFVVESGNGRTMALRKAIDTNKQGYENYKQALIDNGYNIEGFINPILVRMRQNKMSTEERIKFTQQANQTPVAKMSVSEQAFIDKEAFDNETLSLFEGGNITDAKNKDFVLNFAKKTVSANEINDFITKDAKLSNNGKIRIESALLAKALNNKKIVSDYFESTDTELKSILGAVSDASPLLSYLNNNKNYDISKNIIEAVDIIKKSRKDKISVSELTKQTDLERGDVSDLTKTLLNAFHKKDDLKSLNSRSKIAETLIDYAQRAIDNDFSSGDIFGTVTTANDYLESASNKQKSDTQIDELKKTELDDDMIEILENVDLIDDTDIDAMFSSVKGCLLGGNGD